MLETTTRGATRASVRHSTDEPSRDVLRAFGERFAHRVTQAISEISHRHRPIPGGQMTRDLLRGRSASLATYGAVLAAIALEQPAEVAMIFASLAAWLHGVRPMPAGALREAALRESKEQGEADVAMWAAVDAVERGDLAALERLRIETAEHIVALQHVLTVAERECAKLTALPRRYKIFAPSRLVAAGAHHA